MGTAAMTPQTTKERQMKQRHDETKEYYEQFNEECAACRREFGPDRIRSFSPTAEAKERAFLCEDCETLFREGLNQHIETLDSDVIGQELFAEMVQWAAREWLMNLQPEDFETVDDIKEYVHKLFAADWSYHLDDSAEEIIDGKSGHDRLFTDEQAKHMNALRDAAFKIAKANDVDPHEFCMDELRRLNPGQFTGLEWEQATDDMLSAKLPSGNTVNIYTASDPVEMSILTPEATEVDGIILKFKTVDEAKAAAYDFCKEHGQFEVGEELETVDLIASGYEWECPSCGHHNKEIEATEFVTCKRQSCQQKFEANPPEHAIG